MTTHRIDRIITAAQSMALEAVREIDLADGPSPEFTDWADVGEQLWDDVYLSELLDAAKIDHIRGGDLAMARAEYIAECESYGKGLYAHTYHQD